MFDSFDKEKFVVGKEYYTYFMELSNKGNSIRNYTGIMKVKVISNNLTQYGKITEFEIIESKKLSETLNHNIHLYMNGYGCAFCYFFENYNECAKHHDLQIIKYAQNLSTHNKETMYKKLINNIIPAVSKIEYESKAWYKTLTLKEKKYVKWIKEYYDEII